MTNREQFDAIFRKNLMISPEEPLENLDMLNVPCWNSFEHFMMISELESFFSITLNEDEMMSFTTYRRGLELLTGHGIQVN